jgi:hypothetical protein
MCLNAEFGANPVATLRNLPNKKELNRYGGVIFTRGNRDDIQSLEDVKDKILLAISIQL